MFLQVKFSDDRFNATKYMKVLQDHCGKTEYLKKPLKRL